MVTRDVLKVLKLHSPTARAILRTFKTSLVPINHEMHEQVHTIFYLLYSQQNYLNVRYFVRVTYYIKRFNGFQHAHMFYLNQSEI